MSGSEAMDVLLSSFLEALEGPARGEMERVPGLGRQLTALFEEAAAAWPALELPAELYAAYLAQRIRDDIPPDQRLLQLRAADLYIACGCCHGVAAALRGFESDLLPGVGAALASLKLQPAALEELRQVLREKLLAPRPDGPPLISKYSGRGKLAGWVRVTAVNTALKTLRKGRREIPVEEEFIQGLPAGGDDPELQVLKETYRRAFNAAFREAWTGLGARERNLLQLSYIERLSIDALGAIYHVHRATAARWLDRSRASMLERTRAALIGRLGLEDDEFESIMRLIESRLEVTLRSGAVELADGSS